jgi:CubicO group peptidase (beta-lactamase class C family)
MHSKTRVSALLCVVLLTALLAGCAPSPPQPAYWPDAEWRTSTPEEQGLDSASILSMLREIQSRGLQVHSVLIVRHGFLVTEVYFPPYSAELKHPEYSITKSVTSAMTGIAINEGLITGVQQPVLDYFPDVARTTRDPHLPDLTIEHLLTMSAGFNIPTLPADLRGKSASFDAARSVLNNRLLDKPGETFFYDTGLPHVLSTIIQQTSGLTLEEYTRSHLFEPLGITDLSWEADPQGITIGGTGLSLRPEDMARLGYLYLHDGQWNGEQIVPAAWVRASTQLHMKTKGLMDAAEDDGYGYLWWIDSWGGYSAHGFAGQYVFVLPKQDMVVVFTSGLSEEDFPVPHELVTTYLLPAAKSAKALPPNAAADGQLAEEIRKIQDTKGATASLPEIAKQISGKTYRLAGGAGASWPREITFDFPGGDTYVNTILWSTGERDAITGGLDGVFRINHLGPDGQTLMAWRGTWRDTHTFVEEQNFDLKSDADFFTVAYTFDDNKVAITVDSATDSFPTLKAEGEIIE